MTTTDLSDIEIANIDISGLSFAQLEFLRVQIDERIESIREKFIEDAASLGLSLGKQHGRGRRKQRRNAHAQQHE